MKQFLQGLHRLLHEEQGATGIEYAMLASLIAIAFVAGATILGTNLNNYLQYVADCVGNFSRCPGMSGS